MIELCSEYLSVQCIWLYVSYHATYKFQSESILYSCLIVKELLAQSRHEMIDSYLTWQEHTVKCTIEISTQNTAQSLGQLGQWLGVRLQTKWFGVWVQLQSLKLQILRQFRVRSSLTFRLLQSVDSLWNSYMTRQEHRFNQSITHRLELVVLDLINCNNYLKEFDPGIDNIFQFYFYSHARWRKIIG